MLDTGNFNSTTSEVTIASSAVYFVSRLHDHLSDSGLADALFILLSRREVCWSFVPTTCDNMTDLVSKYDTFGPCHVSTNFFGRPDADLQVYKVYKRICFNNCC